MTIRDGVEALNEKVQECAKGGLYAAVVLLVGSEKELFSEEDLHRLDVLRGDKLNTFCEDKWKPEKITREDADLIKRGLDIYKQVLWDIHGKKIIEQIAKSIRDGRLN